MGPGDDTVCRVLLCVSGGIAAYKAPELVRAFVKAGVEVQVVMTPAAEAFVTKMSLTTVSGRPVRSDVLDVAEEGRVGHIDLADWPDLVVVAPATADLMARAAAGLADDLVATVLLATRAPVLWAPAMNTNMWRHPATQANLATLGARGAHFVGPDAGELACGWIGEGRMIDPPMIVDAAQALLDRHAGSDWSGRRVVVSAGPTRAYLDPVRFFSNASTGAMGFAVAAVAAARGAEVTLVAGPVQRPTPPGVRRVDVETATQMLEALDAELQSGSIDLVAMVAAVSDLEPQRPSVAKIAKRALVSSMKSASWTQSPDVLATLTKRYCDRTFFLGFGAQTVEDDDADAVMAALVDAGRDKLRSKGCQAIFVNRVGAPGTGFGSDTNAGVLLWADEDRAPLTCDRPVAKASLAGWLLDALQDEVAR